MHEIKVARGEFDAGTSFLRWFGSSNVESASSGVLAVQRALWAAQYFNLFDVEIVERGDGGPGEVDTIYIVTNPRIDTVIGETEGGALAADADGSVARIR